MNLVIEITMYACECIMQLLCIHAFLDKKLKADIKTMITTVLYVALLVFINEADKLYVLAIGVHILLFVFIIIEFGKNIIESIILVIFNLLVSGAIQLIVGITMSPLSRFISDSNLLTLLINVVALVAMIIVTRMFKMNYWHRKVMEWSKTVILILLMFVAFFVYLFIRYKVEERMLVMSYFISGVMTCFLIYIVLRWQKDRFEIKQKSLELYMHDLYGKSVEGMIENIRIRQHDFKNQLTAIYGMHLTSENFEELVESQKKYCDFLMEESKYDSILTMCKDKILAGFLYTKFMEWENKGVEFDFEIMLSDTKCKVATYELIEITGVLIDNASEAEMSVENHKPIQFMIKDDVDKVFITCRNHTKYMPIEELERLFDKGYSTKGIERGLGLYNIKKILEGKGNIIAGNYVNNEENYLELKVEIIKDS